MEDQIQKWRQYRYGMSYQTEESAEERGGQIDDDRASAAGVVRLGGNAPERWASCSTCAPVGIVEKTAAVERLNERSRARAGVYSADRRGQTGVFDLEGSFS